MTVGGGSIIFEPLPPRPCRRRRMTCGWNGYTAARVARQPHRPGDGGGDHRRRLCADPIARGPPRLRHLSVAGAARGLASRPHSSAGRGGGRRALVVIFFLLALLQLLPLTAE